MTRRKRELRKVEGKEQAERLIELYKRAEADIASKLAQMIDKYGAAAANKPSLKLLKRQYKAIRGQLKALNAAGQKGAAAFVETTYRGGVAVAKQQLMEAGVKVSAEMSGVHGRAMTIYSEQAQSRLADLVTTAGRTASDVYQQLQLNSVMTSAVAGVEALSSVQAKMRRLAEENKLVAFVDKAGHKWSMSGYVEMLTRTTLMQIHNRATWTEFAAHNEDLVLVSVHVPCCPLCAKWNGRVLSLTGKTPGYPTVADAEADGLFHPNCRHATSLYIPDGSEELPSPPEPKPKPEPKPESKPKSKPKPKPGPKPESKLEAKPKAVFKFERARGHLGPNELTPSVIKWDFELADEVISKKEAKAICDAINYYTDQGYRAIRAAQRAGDINAPGYAEGKLIERWLRVAPRYPSDENVYRGLSGEAEYKKFSRLKVGGEYHEGVTASATSQLGVASGFSESVDANHRVVVVIKGGMPHGASILGASEYPEENEVLIK